MHFSSRRSHTAIASPLPEAANWSAAIPRGKSEISNPTPTPQEQLAEPNIEIDDDTGRHHSLAPVTKTDAWPGRSTAPALLDLQPQKSHMDSTPIPSTLHGNNNRASAAMTSTHQSMFSIPSAGSTRKGNGIKSTFRRMFGSKRRRNTFSAVAKDDRNSSGNLFDNAQSVNNRSLRKPSLLFEELIRGRGLNSHAPSATLPESGQDHDKRVETINSPVGGFNRRNSLPSVVLSSSGAQGLDLHSSKHDFGPSHKIHPRPRRMPHRSLIDSVKRKSRSADALQDMARSQNTLQAQERRLSEEIKYWRNSIVEDPVPSLTSSRHEVTGDVGASPSNSCQTPAPPTSPTSVSGHVSPSPLGFDFSSLVIGNGEASVEQRMTTVEVKLVDLECAIANLQGHEVARRVLMGKPPRRTEALPDLSQHATAHSCSTPAIYPKSSRGSFSTDSSAPKDKPEQSGEHRNSVANTLRPGTAAQFDASTAAAPHLPALPKAGTEDEAARLMSMLIHEQQARRGLESQLQDLQKQMNELRFPAVTQRLPTSGNFSTPTPYVPDSPPVSAKQHTILPFRMASPQWVLSREARPGLKENERGEDGTETETNTDTDDGSLDFYETPTEAADKSFGINLPRSPLLVGVM